MSGKPKPFNMLVIDAVCDSNLPADLRHLLIVMAYHADRETGRGFHKQKTIAEWIGCNERSVRHKYERLAEIADSPVQLKFRRRAKKDGSRNSDEYSFTLTKRQPVAGSDHEPSGNALPVGDEGQAATECNPSGNPMQDKRQPAARDPVLDPVLDPVSISAPLGAVSAAPRISKGKKPVKSDDKPEGYEQLVAHYFVEFERLRKAKPTFRAREGKSAKTLIVALGLTEAMRRITLGLQGWSQATINTIAADPDRSVQGATPVKRVPAQGGSSALDRLNQNKLKLVAGAK